MRLLMLLFPILFFSCQYLNGDKERKIIVEYKGQKLYEDDLNKILPKQYSKEDSIDIVDSFIKNWLHKKVAVNNAVIQISDEEIRELDQHISQYREDLLLNKFYNKKLQKLNETAITEQEMIDYYHEHENSFILNEDLSKIQYIIAPISYKDSLLKNVDNSDYLKNTCVKNKELECYSNDEWVNYQKALSTFDLNEEDYPISKLKSEPLMILEKENKFYLIKWADIQSKGEVGPYSHFKNTIKSILINKRKLNLQKYIEDSLYNDAITNDKIKFYE